ncbi:MAG: hypothetical protein ACTSYB_11045 [Candidatus Helarchaeota archaeon]
MAELESLIERLALALEKAQLKYVIVGGFAAIFRGRPRTTMDIDLIIEADSQKIPAFLDYLRKLDFDVLDNQIKMALEEDSHASIFDKQSILRIDLKLAITLDEKEVLGHAKTETYKGINLQIAPVEQILYGKILYLGDISDLSDSELLEINDALDFINVYRQSKTINIEWLRSKAKQKKVLKTLQRLLKLSQEL